MRRLWSCVVFLTSSARIPPPLRRRDEFTLIVCKTIRHLLYFPIGAIAPVSQLWLWLITFSSERFTWL